MIDINYVEEPELNNINIFDYSLLKDKKSVSKQISQIIKELFDTKTLLATPEFYNDVKYTDFFKIKQVKKLVSNSELINTVKCYFDNGLNTSIASMVAYMHRNTMIYRLQKIKNLIGLDIKIFNDAVIFNNMLYCYEIILCK